jgi:2-oxoglutarate dehydrogenase E2 component (dihydrolipoamide succinyltransferase)
VVDIRVPKLNNNDVTYLLVEWLAEEGQPVRQGQPVATLETSKAAEELAADSEGVLVRLLPAGSECEPGQTIARIDPPEGATAEGVAGSTVVETVVESVVEAVVETVEDSGPVLTARAKERIAELGLDQDHVMRQITERGMRVVRTSDVDELIATGERDKPADLYELPAVQRAVAAAVSASHQSIPAAFTALTVNIGAARQLSRELTRRLQTLVGLPELLIAATAALHTDFPLFFASPVDDRHVRLAPAPHIGVTIDVGKGLFVPVVRDAAARDLKDIAKTVMAFRLTALRGTFTEQELAGGNLTIALHTDGDVLLAIPVIFPGQVCALSLGAPRRELVPGDDGAISTRTAATLGLAYDHRVVNGREAVLFLSKIREALESPARLTG